MRDVQAIDRPAGASSRSTRSTSSPGPTSCRCSPGSGPYDTALLERAAHRPPRRLFEYWGHAASLIDVTLQPLLRFRMQAGFRDVWAGVERVARENPDLVDFVRERGGGPRPDQRPAAGGGGGARPRATGAGTGRRSRRCWSGCSTAARSPRRDRNSQFERVYDLPERVLPRGGAGQHRPRRPRSPCVGLVRRAAQALGVASEFCLRDYFRTRPAMTREADRRAGRDRRADSGRRSRAGRTGPATCGTRRGCRGGSQARALLSPFDSMIFERSRLERLFDFFYRIEIYVPSRSGSTATTSIPFLLGDAVRRPGRPQGRPGARGAAGQLGLAGARRRTRGTWPASCAPSSRPMAGWLGLSDVQVAPRGDLGPRCRADRRRGARLRTGGGCRSLAYDGWRAYGWTHRTRRKTVHVGDRRGKGASFRGFDGQAAAHRRGQDPQAAQGHRQPGELDRGRLRRDERRGAARPDRPTSSPATRRARRSSRCCPEAFATVREASQRVLDKRHFDVQVMGGAALHLGNIAEMKTGEGKTLVATAAVVPERDHRPRRARGHGERLPGQVPVGVDGPGPPLPRHGGRRDPVPDGSGGAAQGLPRRHHLRHQQRVRLRLPARQHGAQPGGLRAARAPLRHRGRGRLDLDRRGADAADHLRSGRGLPPVVSRVRQAGRPAAAATSTTRSTRRSAPSRSWRPASTWSRTGSASTTCTSRPTPR